MTRLARTLGLTALLVVAASTCLGCAHPFDPHSGAPSVRPMMPPPAYRQLWVRVGACVGMPATDRAYESIRWFTTPEPWYSPEHDTYVVGVAALRAREITIAESRVTSARVVAHEMFHIMLQRSGHPTIFVTCHLMQDDGSWGDVDTAGIKL